MRISILGIFYTLVIISVLGQEITSVELASQHREMMGRKSESLGDTLSIFFETGFNKSIVEVWGDDILVAIDTITTHEIVDFAWSVRLMPEVNKIGISINHFHFTFPKILGCNYYFVTVSDGKLLVQRSNKFPAYD